MKKYIICSIFVFCFLNLIGQSDSRIARIDQFLEESVADGIIPGGVFKINHKGTQIYNRTLGFANLDKTRSYKEDDIFRIASMTKALTTVAIMQLYENGHLLIDDPLSMYIPAFGETKVLDTFNDMDSSYTAKDLDRPLSLRHLLTHTSGIYYGSFVRGKHRAIYIKNGAMDYGLAHPELSTAQMAEHIATLPLAHQPGTKWTYGLNMEVLGRVVEIVSGMSLDEYFQQNILQPVGMTDTHFYLPTHKDSRLVPVYMQLESGTDMNPDPNLDYPTMGPYDHFAGGGGLSSTAEDYMKFIQVLLDGGSVKGQHILSSRTIDYMRSQQIAHITPKMSDHTRPKGNGFGLGFQVITKAGKGAVPFSTGTYSWGGYFNTKFWIDPVEDLAFVGMTQVVPFRHGKFWDKLYAIIYSSLDESEEVQLSEESSDRSLIKAALLDYVEGIYNVDSSRIETSVHPELRKRGYWYSEKESKYYDNLDMTFEELRHLAATWNAKGNNANEHSPKKIEIFDVNDKTAIAKLTAAWGIDHFQLAKVEGKWLIMNVLWQSITD